MFKLSIVSFLCLSVGYFWVGNAVAQIAPASQPAAGRLGGRGGRGAAALQDQNQPPADSLPREWIDKDTGHRVIRLSTENGSASLYFHYNGYSADGKKLVFTSPSGISEVDLTTFKVEVVVPGQRSIIETGRKTNEVFYTNNGAVYAADLYTHAVRKVVDLPGGGGRGGGVSAVNCDQTLFGGTIMATDPTGATTKPAPRVILPQLQRMFPGKTMEQLTPDQQHAVTKEDGLARRLTNPDSYAIFTVDAKTGKTSRFGYAYAWLNHLQFSPTDPNQIMFCHEGTWHENDRVWTIRTDGTGLKLMHARTMDMEIAGHEFFGADGKWIWFDLQTPRSQVFWIGGVNLASGQEVRYHVEQNQWGVHYEVSHDGKMFSSDGGDPTQVAFCKDGQWMNLFRVQPDGTLKHERLVNMAKQDYLGNNGEPNGTFSPDDKYVIFRSNILGPMHVFAVEVEKSKLPG